MKEAKRRKDKKKKYKAQATTIVIDGELYYYTKGFNGKGCPNWKMPAMQTNPNTAQDFDDTMKALTADPTFKLRSETPTLSDSHPMSQYLNEKYVYF